jgi:Fe-Mn family superoxide dismutase
MEQRIQPLPFDPSQLSGLSERLLRSHHQNNYSGAVKRLNAIRAKLASLDMTGMAGFDINGIKREELIAHNSMLLHELHFNSMCAQSQEMAPAMALALCTSFGSVRRWRDEFVAMGRALGGGSGWVTLCFQVRDGSLVNQWAADHAHALVGCVPILALDMYEHAYHMDFGADVGAYVDAFMQNIHWESSYERYQHAVHSASDAWGVEQSDVGGAQLLDVRRDGMFAMAATMIKDATWRDPALVTRWASQLPLGADVVVYCVYGHEVGRSTAMRLRACGINARFLRGGIDAWHSAGLPVVEKVATA